MDKNQFTDITFVSAWITIVLTVVLMAICAIIKRFIIDFGLEKLISIIIIGEAVIYYWVSKYLYMRKYGK